MRDIASLRQDRAKAYSELEAIQATAANDNRGFTAEEQRAFDEKASQVEAFDAQIKSAERVQALKASTAIPAPASVAIAANDDLNAPVAGPRAEPRAREHREPGVGFAQLTRALVLAKGDVEAAHSYAAKTWGEGYDVTAALQANDASAGGFLIPERLSLELITFLRPKAVIRRNCRVVPLVGGTDTMPTVETGTSAFYIGEGSDIGETEPTFGNLKFVEREIAALVPISNKLLRNSSQNVDMVVRDDLALGFAQAEDQAFLRSNGVGPAPKGIRYLAGTTAAQSGTTIAAIDADSRKLINGLATHDIPMINVRWVMNPRVFGYLQDLRDANSNPVYAGLQLAQPTFKGYPVEQTNNVPINLGSGSDSEIYLVDFNEAVIADTFQVRIDASESASYKVGGTLVSAYSRNQTVIRAVAAHDFGLRRVLAAAVLTGVTLGS